MGLFSKKMKPGEIVIQNIIDDLPKHPFKKYSKRNLKRIKQVVIHHSADNLDHPSKHARYHVEDKEWPGIGYAFVVGKKGEIWQTQPLDVISYHARSNNSESLGVMVIGNFMETTPSNKQMVALHKLLRHLKSINRDWVIKGHRDVVETDCPGELFPMDEIKSLYNKKRNGKRLQQDGDDIG